MTSHNFARGDRVRYNGPFVNMRGECMFLDYDGPGRVILRAPYDAPRGEATIERVSLCDVEARP